MNAVIYATIPHSNDDYICLAQKPQNASADNPAGPEEEEEDEEESLRLLRLAALKSKKEDSISHVSNITVVFARKKRGEKSSVSP